MGHIGIKDQSIYIFEYGDIEKKVKSPHGFKPLGRLFCGIYIIIENKNNVLKVLSKVRIGGEYYQ